MELDRTAKSRTQLGRFISIGIVIAAVILGFVVLYQTNYYPRTDDAEIFANFIGIAPQVEGPLIRLCVHDNQFVKKGELLYEIDERHMNMLSREPFPNKLVSRGKSQMRPEELRRW
jgi:membrane fusion protein, multidrug efflux system